MRVRFASLDYRFVGRHQVSHFDLRTSRPDPRDSRAFASKTKLLCLPDLYGSPWYPAIMTFDGLKRNPAILVFCGVMAVSLAGLLLLPPTPQDQKYHQFADQRTILGIPNFWNVVSNLPFLAVGAAGLRRFRYNPATIVFFVGVFSDRHRFLLLSLGSERRHHLLGPAADDTE